MRQPQSKTKSLPFVRLTSYWGHRRSATVGKCVSYSLNTLPHLPETQAPPGCQAGRKDIKYNSLFTLPDEITVLFIVDSNVGPKFPSVSSVRMSDGSLLLRDPPWQSPPGTGSLLQEEATTFRGPLGRRTPTALPVCALLCLPWCSHPSKTHPQSLLCPSYWRDQKPMWNQCHTGPLCF